MWERHRRESASRAHSQEGENDEDDNKTAIMSVRSTSRTEARIVVVRSSTMVVLIADGIEAFSDGSTAFTRSTVFTMSPGLPKDDQQNARLPFR